MLSNVLALLFAMAAAATASTCPVLDPSFDSSQVRSTEPLCVKSDELYVKIPVVEKGEVDQARADKLDAIISGALGDNVDFDKTTSYIIAIALFAILPLITCLCNGCCGGCHCFARLVVEFLCPAHFATLCAGCMCRPSAFKPYEKSQKTYPILLWAVFTAGGIFIAIYGTAGGTAHFQTTFIRGACNFQNTQLKISTFLAELRHPILGFKSTFGAVSDNIKTKMGSTGNIDTAIDELVSAYKDVSSAAVFDDAKYSSTDPRENPAGTHTIGCIEPLKIIRELTTEASNEANASGVDLKNQLEKTGQAVNATMVDKKVTITQAIDDAAALLDNLKMQVEDSMAKGSTTLLGQAKALDDDPNIMSGVSFAAFNWIYLCVLLMVVGFIFILLNSHAHNVIAGQVHSNPHMEGDILDVGHIGACGARMGALSWCCIFFFGAVASGLGTAFYPISKVYGDVCTAIEILPLKLGTLMEGDRTGSSSQQNASNGMNVTNILTTCWADGSIYDAMDLETLIPIDSSEMFAGFGGVPSDGSLGNDSTVALNELAAEIQNMQHCPAARTVLLAKIDVVHEKTDDLEMELATYQQTLDTIQNTSVARLEGQMDLVKCVKCGFIRSVWEETFDVVCRQAHQAIVIFAESMVAIGVFAFFVGMLQLVILRRWAGLGPIKAHDHGDDGFQLAMTHGLESKCGCLSHHRRKVVPSYAVQKVDQNTTSDYTVEVSEGNNTTQPHGSDLI